MLNIAVIAFTYPLYLHYLGYESYGLWLILSTVLAFSRIGDLGICAALSKLLAEAEGKGDQQLFSTYLKLAFRVLIVTAVLVSLLLYLLMPLLMDSFGWEGKELIPYLALLCALGMWTEVWPAILAGLGRMDLANITTLSGRMLGAGLSIVLMAYGYGLWSLLWGSFFSYLCIQLLATYLIGPTKLIDAVAAECCRGHLRRMMKLGLGIVGGSLTSLALQPLTRILLGHYAGLAAVPVFDIAYRGSMQLRGVLEAGLRALMPAFSYMNEGEQASLWELKRKAQRLTLFYGSAVYLLAALGADMVLRFWLGDQFVPELTTACLFALGGSYLSLMGVPIYYFAMGLGRVKVTLCSHLLQALANMAVLFTLILWTGELSATAAALSLLISFALSNLYLFVEGQRFSRKLGAYS